MMVMMMIALLILTKTTDYETLQNLGLGASKLGLVSNTHSLPATP